MVAKIPLKSKVTIHRLNRKCYKVFKIKRCISGGTLKLTHLSMGEKKQSAKKGGVNILNTFASVFPLVANVLFNK